jgi:ParB-like chromosome segregation protein Spo0J
MSERWQSRIVEHGEADPMDLIPNPENFRSHPDKQAKELQRVMDQIGWVEGVIVNRTTGHLVDGHLRVAQAIANGEPVVPVDYVELDMVDEKLALASLDRVGAMAVRDDAALVGLLDDIGDGLGTLAGWMRSEGRPAPSPSQDRIDQATDDLESKFSRERGRAIECKCPECGEEFGLAGTGVTS